MWYQENNNSTPRVPMRPALWEFWCSLTLILSTHMSRLNCTRTLISPLLPGWGYSPLPAPTPIYAMQRGVLCFHSSVRSHCDGAKGCGPWPPQSEACPPRGPLAFYRQRVRTWMPVASWSYVTILQLTRYCFLYDVYNAMLHIFPISRRIVNSIVVTLSVFCGEFHNNLQALFFSSTTGKNRFCC